MNVGSRRACAYCSRSSSSAWISVSATNTPPYGPKWPRESGKSPICTTYLANECEDLGLTLDAFARSAILTSQLDAARHVHAPRTQLTDRGGNVVRREPAGEDQASRRRGSQLRRQHVPVEGRPGAAGRPAGLMGIEQQRARTGKSARVF